MGNTYLRIPDTLIRKSFQEVYDELYSKINKTNSSISAVASQAIWAAENGYDYEKLQEDLKKGVSLVFKDITEFDETFPSAIAIGDIELNEDSTVKYGSRGVAITKNGLAGFDETYNGAGDLPSFSLDTYGNLYLRGEVHAESGTFAGELKSAYGTFDTITAGVLQNSDGSNKIDLNASGSQYFITLGWLDYLRSDGRFRLGNGTLIWDGTTFKLTSTDDTPNEVRNFNFDNGEDYWVFDEDLEHSVILYTQAPTDCPDVYALKVRNINEAAENKTVYQIHSDTSDYIETAEAEEFTLICYGATDIGSHATFDLSLDYYDDNGYISSDYETFTPTANWQKFVMRAKTPSGATKAQLTLTLNNPQYVAEGYIEQDYVEAGYTEEGYILQDYVEQDTAFVYLTNIYLKRTRFGDDRVEISGRDISFYKTLEETPYKTVKKIESGVANNGDTVNLTGFYDRQPKIIVSPNNLQIFESDNPNQDQTIKCYPYNFTGNINTGEWSFQARAELVIATNDGSVVNFFDNDYIASCFLDSGYCNSCGEKTLPDGATKVSFNITANCYNVTDKDTNNECLYTDYIRWKTSFYYRILVDSTDVTGWKYFGLNGYNISSQNITFSTDEINITNKSKVEIEFKSAPESGTECTNTSNDDRCSYAGNKYYGVVIKDSTAYFDYAGDTKLADGSLNWIAIG